MGVDKAIAIIKNLGRGCLLAKFDLKNVYRSVPVHLQDRHLLAITWNGNTFIDTVLPFGLRSAPKIFSAVADALLWMIAQRGVHHALHYLDNFLIAWPARLHSVCLVAPNSSLHLLYTRSSCGPREDSLPSNDTYISRPTAGHITRRNKPTTTQTGHTQRRADNLTTLACMYEAGTAVANRLLKSCSHGRAPR